MHIKQVVVLACATLSTAAMAQAQADLTYSGRWSATIVAGDGSRQVSRLELHEYAGTWFGPVAPAKATCKAKKFPVTVQDSTAIGLAFTVWGATAGPGCRDLTIEMKPVTENAFEGTVESVGTIKLVRR